MRPGHEASPTGVGPANEDRQVVVGVSVEGEAGLVQALAAHRPVGFIEAVCSCGSEAIVGACILCGELRCGSCSAGVRNQGIVCDDCRWGRAVG